MNKIFTFLSIMFFSAILTYAQQDTVRYTFQVSVPTGLAPVGSGSIKEGESFTLNSHSFSEYPFIQEAYNAIAGSYFSFPENALNESVTLSITLKNLKGDSFGYNDLAGNPIFLYFEVAVIGDSSGAHGSNSSYNLNSPAVLTIPMTEAFKEFVTKCGISISDGLAIAYYDGNSLSNVGINTEIIHNPEALQVSISHFSRFGGTGKTKLSDISEKDGNLALKEFSLVQNYPNPFNPTTNISYYLPENGYVTLKVYNAIGAEIKTLVSSDQKAGSHEVMFNAENLPSGVYFYTIRFDNNTQTKRMILIK